jgi:hypothetical protein
MKQIIFGGLLAVTLVLGTMPALRAGEVDRTTIKVTASTWETKAKGGFGDMPPERSLDGDLKTAWMAEGDGVWIQYDLGAVQALKGVKLAFSSGDKRVYTFDVQVSPTGADGTWVTVGDKLKSSGTALDEQEFDFPTAKVQFVRIVGHGNTSEKFPNWCNVTEAAFVTE